MPRLVFAFIIAIIGTAVIAIGGVGIALALENQDAFCASCHTQPESAYFQRSVQARSSDLASYHTKQKTNCIDCHSGAGTLGRAQGLQQGAHDLVNYIQANYHSPAITLNPLGDASCVKCHSKIFERAPGSSKAGTGHYHFYLPQWQQADSNAAHCVTCHAPHTESAESLKFMNQGKVGQECEKCHDSLSGVVK